ncbi:hypothetical protein BHECKSOX_433, partial [Bathymodiolus heckerae thiotrophic gill symbiont]
SLNHTDKLKGNDKAVSHKLIHPLATFRYRNYKVETKKPAAQ